MGCGCFAIMATLGTLLALIGPCRSIDVDSQKALPSGVDQPAKDHSTAERQSTQVLEDSGGQAAGEKPDDANPAKTALRKRLTKGATFVGMAERSGQEAESAVSVFFQLGDSIAVHAYPTSKPMSKVVLQGKIVESPNAPRGYEIRFTRPDHPRRYRFVLTEEGILEGTDDEGGRYRLRPTVE